VGRKEGGGRHRWSRLFVLKEDKRTATANFFKIGKEEGEEDCSLRRLARGNDAVAHVEEVVTFYLSKEGPLLRGIVSLGVDGEHPLASQKEKSLRFAPAEREKRGAGKAED